MASTPLGAMVIPASGILVKNELSSVRIKHRYNRFSLTRKNRVNGSTKDSPVRT
jgi:hypothetical protein